MSAFGVPPIYYCNMKSISKAYCLWLLSIFGWFGIHRFYLKKRTTGYLWLFTFGLFGLGSLLDLIWLNRMVDTYNAKILLPQLEKELETIKKVKEIVLTDKNYESAKWYKEKEILLVEEIEKCKKYLSL